MIKRFSFLALAAVVALALSAPANAGDINVYQDAGGGSADVLGTATGATVSTASYPTDYINSINGVLVTPITPLSITATLTDVGGVITGSGVKDIGTTVITFTVTGGSTALLGHLNLDGTIGTVTNPTENVGYNFAPLAGGLISISFDKVGVNFADVLDHAGASALATGLGVQEAAIPEPASMALLGIGMTGLLVFRRLFKRRAATA